jgi:hypothetical protein
MITSPVIVPVEKKGSRKRKKEPIRQVVSINWGTEMKRVAVAICLTAFGCAELPNSAKRDSSKNEDGCSANASVKKASLMMRNGETASEDDYPFAGMLYAKNMRITVFPPLQVTQKSCSATLVCKNVVMTAAHCIAGGELASKFTFHPGVKPGETPQITLSTARGAEYKILHKDGEVGRKDIALLRLDRDLTIQPAKIWLKTLPELKEDEGGSAVKIFGYGNTKHQDGQDVGAGTKKIGSMLYQGHMNRPESEETHQMAILHPSQGLNAPLSESTNACSGDSGGAAMVGGRVYGVLAKIMFSKDGKLQGSPNCKESNITLAAVLARQKNWVTENLEKMCSGGLSLDDDEPPFEPLPSSSIANEKDKSDDATVDDISEDSSVANSPCE